MCFEICRSEVGPHGSGFRTSSQELRIESWLQIEAYRNILTTMTMLSFRISTQNLWGVESGISPKKTVPRWVCSCGDIALSRMEPQAKWVGCYSCSLRTVESWKTASLEWIGQRIPRISCDCHVSLTSTSLVEKLLSSPYNDRGYRRSYGDRRDANRRPEENENWRELPWICLFTYILLATWYKPDATSILLMTQGKLQKSISKLRYGRLLIHLETWKTRLIDQSSIHCSFLQNTRQSSASKNHVIVRNVCTTVCPCPFIVSTAVFHRTAKVYTFRYMPSGDAPPKALIRQLFRCIDFGIYDDTCMCKYRL